MVHRIYLDAALYKCKSCDHTEEFYTNGHSLGKINSIFQTRPVFFWDSLKNEFSKVDTGIKNRTPPYKELYNNEDMAWTEMIVKCKNCNNGVMQFVETIDGKHKSEFEKMEREKTFEIASLPFDPPKNCHYDIMDSETGEFIKIEPGFVDKNVVIITMYPKDAEIYYRERAEKAEKDNIPF